MLLLGFSGYLVIIISHLIYDFSHCQHEFHPHHHQWPSSRRVIIFLHGFLQRQIMWRDCSVLFTFCFAAISLQRNLQPLKILLFVTVPSNSCCIFCIFIKCISKLISFLNFFGQLHASDFSILFENKSQSWEPGRKEGNVDKVFFFLMFSYFCASLTQIIVKLLFEKASNRRPCQQQKCPPATLCPSKSWYVSTNVKLSFDSNFQGKLGNCKLEDLPV